MNFPKVSVIVPIYNVERYLDRCMQSLLSQTLKDIEIILVDDESPDNCPAMCDEYARIDSRIKVIHKKNGGLGFARNSGLEIASGEFVAFVDSDDYVDLKMFEVLYNEASSRKLDVLFCNFFELKKDGQIKEIIEVKKNEFYETKEDIFNFLLNMIGAEPSYYNDRRYSMSVWHGIYKYSVIHNNKIIFPTEREMISEDVIFHILFLSQSNNIGYLTNCFYYYCENPTSLTNIYRFDRYERYKILHCEIVRLLSELFPNELFKIKLSANRLLLGYIRAGVFYNKRDDIIRIVNDNYLIDMIKEYPYEKSNFRDKVFILTIKGQQLSLLELLFKLNRLKKKWKKILQ